MFSQRAGAQLKEFSSDFSWDSPARSVGSDRWIALRLCCLGSFTLGRKQGRENHNKFYEQEAFVSEEKCQGHIFCKRK